ncbi:MAG TPA: Na+/H+ antiporter subunit B [Candidatus Eisenbacteria bacterium]|nr:Na+/H+ antiporter subunit B [Candidatus Eisenbacteria bacterium]
MKSLILQTVTRLMLTLLLLFSVFLLLRGHNQPGGGFVAGLVASGAVVLYAIAYDVATARRALRFEPHALIGSGLLLICAVGVWPMIRGEPFLTGQWFSVPLGEVPIAVGTPLVFDAGVFLVVLGMTLLVVLTLGEE